MYDILNCTVCQNDVPAPDAYYSTRRDGERVDERVYCGQTCRAFANDKHHLSIPGLQARWAEHVTTLAAANHFLYARR